MPDYRSQIAETVDSLVKEGAIPADMRERYIEMMAADDKVAERFAGMLMRAGDYTRKTQSLAEQRRQAEAELAAERARVAQEQAALKQWEQEARQEIENLRLAATQNPALQVQIAKYEQKLKEYNLLEEEDRIPIPNELPKPKGEAMPVQQQEQNLNYLQRDEAASAIRDLMSLQGQIVAIAGEHQALFGKPLTDNIFQEALNAGVQDIRQYWESKYNVSGKRAEVEAASRAAEIERIKAETRAAVMAELTADPNRVIGGQPFQPSQPSPIFDRYAASRAVVPTAEGTKSLRDIAPELRPDGQAHEFRVNRAMERFMKDFNADGSPRLAGGPAQ